MLVSKQIVPDDSGDDGSRHHQNSIDNHHHSRIPIQNNQDQLELQNLESNKRKQKEIDEIRYEKYRKYDPKSLFLFSNRWRIRQKIIALLLWKSYDYFMILSIAGNSLCLAMTDYSDDENLTDWNQTLNKVDQVFTFIYAFEAILKIIAFGFVFHKKSYLRDPWNVLDFLVVIIGLISLIPQVPNLKSLRTMRVLRPLRSINAVPSMKRLVATLLMSLPRMGYLVFFLMFFIGVSAILGMQIFQRDLYFRCRLTDEPTMNNTQWEIDPNQQSLCGGYYTCNAGTYCHSLIERQIPLEVDKVEEWEFVQYGYFHFDNIGVSILSIFRVITLEGWSVVMYNYLDSSGFLAGIYFPMLVVIGSFFLLNLFLAVIMETFSEMNSKNQGTPKLEKQDTKFMIAAAAAEGSDPPTPNYSKQKSVVNKMIMHNERTMHLNKKNRFTLADAALLYVAKHKKDSQENMSSPLDSPINEKLQIDAPLSPLSFESENISSEEQEQDIAGPIQEAIPELELEHQESNLRGDDLESGQSIQIPVPLISNGTIIEEQNHTSNLQESQISDAMSPFHYDLHNVPHPTHSRYSIRRFFLIICESRLFTTSINLLIVMNTICLGLDSYPTDEDLQKLLDVINIIFFILFFFEMVVKILGMGPSLYIQDQYNIFDALIVSLSIVDVTYSYSMPQDEIKQGKGAISAFRAFRLLRVFKLAKSWTKLKNLLQTIVKSLKDISSFSVLLFLLMFIYVLLGMEIFADKNIATSEPIQYVGGNPADRANFDNFLTGFIVIFTVLTGESWDQTMFQFAKKKGYIAIFFFISLIIVGVMIFLNLFLAILLENFDDVDLDAEDGDVDKSYKKETDQLQEKLKEYLDKSLRFTGLIKYMPKQMTVTEIIDVDDDNADDSQRELKFNNCVKIGPTGNEMPNITVSPLNVISDPQTIRQPHFEGLDVHINPYTRRISKISNLESIKEIDEDRSPARNDSITHILAGTGFIQRYGQGVDSNAQTSAFFNMQSHGANVDAYSDGLMHDADSNIGGGGLRSHDINILQSQRTQRSADLESSPDFTSSTFKKQLPDQKPRFRQQNSGIMMQTKRKQSQDNMSVTSSPPQSRSGRSKSIALIMIEKNIEATEKKIIAELQTIYCEGNSLWCLSDTNKFRNFIARLVKSHYFEMLILVLICLSSIMLALDNPLNDPNSTLVQILKFTDVTLTLFFAGEAVFKIITFGFLLNNESSYMRNGWNIIDFLVVVVSIISLSITSTKLKIVKILRLLRVLRPLRVISRNKGLKIGIQALFMAVPSLINVIIVSMLFFVIFGVIGVNYFKGTFYTCSFGDQYPDSYQNILLAKIYTKNDCLNWGGAWVNADQSFDNVPEAMSTLFQMSTTEGWIDVMYQGIDSTGIDFQPKRNQNILWSFFFMAFIILGNFLILNLFVGVVVSTFNREKEILGKNFLLTEKQKKWLEQKKECMGINPKVLVDDHHNQFRQFFLNLAQSKRFDIFILVCIIMNTLVLAINWYSQPVFIDDILDYINYGFALIFTFEAIIKLIAFGPTMYLRETGNIFDIVIVISSIITSIVSISMDIDFGASTTFLRALRIARIFKYIKESKQIKVIFETVVVTIPALTNIGGLLLLFLYIFAVLGVFLFSELKLQSNIDIHSNFQTFASAFLTLLRSSTGEGWNSLMKDTTRQRSILFQCDDSDFDFSVYESNNYQTQACGSIAGVIFFMSYMLLVPLIFLNLFIAIILEGFEQTSKKVSNCIQEEDLYKFRDIWALFDKNATGFIKMNEFSEFMLTLGEPLGWDSKYRDNLEMQDDFMEELNITTYNNFRDYLFWDVVQALSKIHMVKLNMHDSHHQQHQEQDAFNSQHSQDDDGEENKDDYGSERQLNNRTVSSKMTNTKRNLQSMKTINKEKKLELRLELEFENFDDERQGVMDVEEIKRKENRMMRAFDSQKDNEFTSAHIKAARKIMAALKRLKENKQARQLAKIYGDELQLQLPRMMVKRQNTVAKEVTTNRLRSKGLIQFHRNKTLRHHSVNMSPKKDDGRSPGDGSVFNSSNNHLLEDMSVVTARNREEQKTVWPAGISGMIREYQDSEGYDEEAKSFGEEWNEMPSNQQQQSSHNSRFFRMNNNANLIVPPNIQIEPTTQPSIGETLQIENVNIKKHLRKDNFMRQSPTLQ